jgi:hypothetical protein
MPDWLWNPVYYIVFLFTIPDIFTDEREQQSCEPKEEQSENEDDILK